MIISQLKKTGVLIVQFGLGLVGKAIKQSITLIDPSAEKTILPFSWQNEEKQEKELGHLYETIKKKNTDKVIFIWSAGKCGFMASNDQTKKELLTFESTIKSISTFIQSDLVSKNTYFYLISSSGGIYEGQLNISHHSPHSIRRAYGNLKLAQETLLSKVFKNGNYKIFRLSTVYSESNFSNRLGLIGTLVANGIKGKVCTIFGKETTLRDFIRDIDLGLYIVKNILAEQVDDSAPIQLIYSGKPYSIFEIKQIIEKKLKKKLLINYLWEKHNASNITYNHNYKLAGFHTVPMETSIQRIINNYRSSIK